MSLPPIHHASNASRPSTDAPSHPSWRPLLTACGLAALATLGCHNTGKPNTTAPEPSGQIQSTPDNPANLCTLTPIADNVWVHTSDFVFNGTAYPSNGLVIAQGRQAVLVDTPGSEAATAALLHAVKETLGLSVAACLVTHFHDDCVAGVPVLEKAGVPCFATQQTQDLCKAHGNAVPKQVLPSIGQAGDETTWQGLTIFHPGHGHAPDNIVVWDDRSNVLFGGCAVKAASATSKGNLSDADVASWTQAMDRIGQRFPEADWIVPGHGNPTPQADKNLLTHTQAVLAE